MPNILELVTCEDNLDISLSVGNSYESGNGASAYNYEYGGNGGGSSYNYDCGNNNAQNIQAFSSSSKGVESIDDVDVFDNILANAGSKLVVLKFHATWCPPCKGIAPKYVELAKQNPDVIFLEIEVEEDAAADLGSRYNVRMIPTFIFIKNGEQVDAFSGANCSELEKTIERLK
ncbi:thioredoxin [Nilaparvata lugens]|uniref:thioredoxin n=1 Tax=Nilaparvata lugens TaxID=108931 RepID=UPI00193E1566|nr:thioredoxin [Nilaparvata lugens]